MSSGVADFTERYRAGFDAYRSSPCETALRSAYELGRFAVSGEMSVLELAAAHHEALAAALDSAADPEDVVRAAGEFFVESISAFEVWKRVLEDARETALVERRQANVLRRLSTFLGDASLALGAADTLEEMLQLVAEHGRELIEAAVCSARLVLQDEHGAAETIEGIAGDSAPRPEMHELSAPLAALDGTRLGVIQLFDGRDFSELDEAVLVQLAQMASAAVERALLYRSRR